VELQSRLIKNFNYKFGTDTSIEKPLVFILFPLEVFITSTLILVLRLVPTVRPFDINLGVSSKTKLGVDYKGNSEIFKIHDNGSRMTYLETAF
jgi:hypothetical protein